MSQAAVTVFYEEWMLPDIFSRLEEAVTKVHQAGVQTTCRQVRDPASVCHTHWGARLAVRGCVMTFIQGQDSCQSR